ncbi:MAG TPA: helix-turn-helix domain-containing protein [Pyrinomonadaceae bacterium]
MHRFVQVSFDLVWGGRYLTTPAKWLYVVLKSFQNHRSKRTFPGYEKIMKQSGMTRNAVAKGLKELEHWGYIVRNKTSGKVNNYEFRSPAALSNGEDYYPTKAMAEKWADDLRTKRNQKKSLK